jgi:hypothetical protein
VKETDAKMPLYAWLREKTGALTEDQRQQEVRVASERLTSFSKRIRPISFVVMGTGAALFLVGVYEIREAFALVSGGALPHGPLTIGSTLLTVGIFVLTCGIAFYASQRSMSRAIAAQRNEDPQE